MSIERTIVAPSPRHATAISLLIAVLAIALLLVPRPVGSGPSTPGN
ncbi:MAG: hypothetical protein IPK28_22475 [Devosia sp.]|nr:hypothetical protein [Devosia sp.]